MTGLAVGDRVYVSGRGRMRYGVIDKVTRTRVWVRYEAPSSGRRHVVQTLHSQVFATAAEYEAEEERRQRAYEEKRAAWLKKWDAIPEQRLMQRLGVKA